MGSKNTMSWVIQGRRVLDELCRVVKKPLHFIDDGHLWQTKAARPLCWLLGWTDDQRPGHGDSSIAVRHFCSGRCDRSWGGWRRPPGPQSPPLQSQHISWWSCWTLPSTFTKNLKLWAYWRAWFVEQFLVLTFDNQLYCNHTGHCELSVTTLLSTGTSLFQSSTMVSTCPPNSRLPKISGLASSVPERKRKVAIKCLELEEMLERQGWEPSWILSRFKAHFLRHSQSEIESKVASFRALLLRQITNNQNNLNNKSKSSPEPLESGTTTTTSTVKEPPTTKEKRWDNQLSLTCHCHFYSTFLNGLSR